MSEQVQNRLLAGAAGAGRYTYKTNSEANADLPADDDAAYNADGTWFFPPRPRSAAQSADFWENCHVPDEILDQFRRVYSANWDDDLGVRMQAGLAQWENNYRAKNAAPKRIFTSAAGDDYEAELHRVRCEEAEEIRNDALRERPRVMHVYDTRALARAARMFQFAPLESRQPDESRKAMEHPVDLYDEVLTVEGVEQKYRLSNIVAALDEVFPDTGKQDELIETVSSVKSAVDEMNAQYARIIEDMEEARNQNRR